MNNRKRNLLIAVLALIICGLGLILFLSYEPSAPVYNGKPLTYWLTGYATGADRPDDSPERQEAERAVRQMGTNCLPRLLRMLQRHASPLKIKVRKLLQRQRLFDFASLDPGQDSEAFWALETMAPTASNAVSELIRIYDSDSSAFAQQSIPVLMGEIGLAASPAIPMLLRAATHTNAIVRNNAIYALGQIRADPDKVVPVLMKCLNDPDIQVEAQAIKSLGEFGTNARPALPALVERLHREKANSAGKPAQSSLPFSRWVVYPAWTDSRGMYYSSSSETIEVTQEALESIDPEPAAKAGIK